jgi:hypothetical protein
VKDPAAPDTTCQYPNCHSEGTEQPHRWHGRLCDEHGAWIEFLTPGVIGALDEQLRAFAERQAAA